jgi:hypothetical protein
MINLEQLTEPILGISVINTPALPRFQGKLA